VNDNQDRGHREGDDWVPPWPHDEDIKTFAERLQWIALHGYDDEGPSAFLPLFLVADILVLAHAICAGNQSGDVKLGEQFLKRQCAELIRRLDTYA
jgi:hypothetical protein